jgi:thiosulfate/3-mercaptopyruvate sulfurtransferase
MYLRITKPIVSVDWLQSKLGNENLFILDCTIPKVTANSSSVLLDEKRQIKGAIFVDIKNTFSLSNAAFPNTALSAKEFEEKAKDLGINNESIIICYDDLGIYSSPRVWWMFKLMGFTNIAVLDGGFPAWNFKNYSTEKPTNQQPKKGDFVANYQSEKIKYTADVLSAIEIETVLITDARSKGRFYTTQPEPRIDVKGGHIPTSVSLPYSELLVKGIVKSEKELKEIFNTINPKKKEFIFSCGTGITACVLALGAEISGIENYAVYDGSWTEWGSTDGLPIENKMDIRNWTRKEFEAYVLLYAAHCNFFEAKEEQEYILSKVDKKTFHKIHTEVVVDSDEISLNRIQEYISENKLNQKEKEDLIRDIKNVFFADGSVDVIEKKVFSILKKIID